MPVHYDPDILQQHAQNLYDEARRIVVATAAKYAIIAFVVVWITVNIINFVARLRSPITDPTTAAALLGAIGLAVGVNAGRVKGIGLKIQAQHVLCQCQIELNTRDITKSLAANANYENRTT